MASYKKQSDKWTVRFRWIDEQGQEKNKRLCGFKTKKQAEIAFYEFLREHPRGNPLKPAKTQILTFKHVVYEFLAWQKSRVKVSTHYDFEKIFDKHILPIFQDRQIESITKQDILQWQESLNKQNYSFKYKSKLRGYLFGVLKYAQKYYDFENVMTKVDAFVKPKIKKEMHVWTLQDFQKFIAATKEPYTSFFMCLYFLGLRLGECLALSPADFDFNNAMVTISKSITEKVQNKPYEIVTPKNMSSYRQIEMPAELKKHMQEHFKTVKQNDMFVFGGLKPFATTTLRRTYSNYLNVAEVPKIRLHDFRHSHASLLIELGANVVLIAKRLGHANIEMTLNTYSHLMPNTEHDIITKLDTLKLSNF